MSEPARRDTAYYSHAYWSPQGWVLYPDGTVHAAPSDLTPPNGEGHRTSGETGWDYRPFGSVGLGGHLYFLPDSPDAEVSTGRLVNSHEYRAGKFHTGLYGARRGTAGGSTHAYAVTFQKVAPVDKRGVVKWKMISTLRPDINPSDPYYGYPGTPSHYTGREFSQWPPRPARRFFGLLPPR